MVKVKYIAAVVFLFLMMSFMAMALTAECGVVMDPVKQQIKEESIIM